MNLNQKFTAFWTIFSKEVIRLLLVWKSTIIAPLISTSLYFLIFGTVIGSRIGEIEGFSYMKFIIPGIIMMPAITGSYMHTAFAVFLQKFQRSIEDIVISPTPHAWMLAGFVLSGVVRGAILSTSVYLVSLIFSHDLYIYNIGFVLLFIVLTSLAFSLIGFTSALYSKNFDDNNIIPTFVLTPLTYLGGVFYSIKALPGIWQTISRANPVLYMVNGFRYGFLGVSDVNVWFGVLMLSVFIIVLTFLNLHLLKKGVGLKH